MDFVIETWTNLRPFDVRNMDPLFLIMCVVLLGSMLMVSVLRRRKPVCLDAAFDAPIQPVITGIRVMEDRSMYISQLAVWFELKLANRKSAPLEIKDIYVDYDGSSHEQARPLGMFDELEGSGQDVKIGRRLRLPYTLGPRESLCVYALVPIPVSEVVGDLLAKTNASLLFDSAWIRKEIDESIEMMSHNAPGFLSLKKDFGIKSVQIEDKVLHEENGVIEIRPNAGYLPNTAWTQLMNAVETREERKAVRSLHFTGLTFGIRSALKRKVEASVPTAQSPFSFAGAVRGS